MATRYSTKERADLAGKSNGYYSAYIGTGYCDYYKVESAGWYLFDNKNNVVTINTVDDDLVSKYLVIKSNVSKRCPMWDVKKGDTRTIRYYNKRLSLVEDIINNLPIDWAGSMFYPGEWEIVYHGVDYEEAEDIQQY